MKYLDLIDKILDASKGILDEAEVYISLSENLSIATFQGEIDKYEIADGGGLSLRGIYDGNMGYAYTEKLDESSIDFLISSVKENSKYLEGDEEFIYEGSKEYGELKRQASNIGDFSIDEKIDLLLKLDKEMGALDSRITERMTYWTEFKSKKYLGNSKGLRLQDEFEGGIISASSVARDEEETKTGSSYRIFIDFNEARDYRQIAKEAVEDSINKIGGRPVDSKDYKIVFDRDTFSSLLGSFMSIFSAETVQKELSLLKDRIGERIAVEEFTLLDNPLLENGFGSRTFDGEGTKTREIELISNGVLKNYLYNWKTAKKDGLESSGNASRSYKGSVGIATSNLYIEEGKLSKEEILKEIKEGLFIDSLQGLHSGLNSVSGDFSLSASGYEIKEGEIRNPVNQITIAGNFFELLMNISHIGNNLKFGRTGGGTVGCPTIAVKTLAVSGK